MIIDNGKVKQIKKSGSDVKADRIIDAEENLVIPGCIDPHIHSREPQSPNTPINQEDFSSVTRAAAAGGYTTVFDMPVNGHPPTTTLEGFKIKKNLAEKKCLIDYALYGGAGYGNRHEIMPLAMAGVIAFKIFTREIELEDKSWNGVIVGKGGSEAFLRIMNEVAKTRLPLSIHCEDDRLIEFQTNQLKSQGKMKASAYSKSAPNASEFIEVSRSIKLAKKTGTKIIIAHLSTAEAASMVKKAKRDGLHVYAETCPHYLLLTNIDMVEKLGPYGKIYPPLRSDHDREALWTALKNKTIDFLANDHAPHSKESKELGWKNIFNASFGVPGLETALPLMLTQVNQGRLDIFRLVEIMSRKPAMIFGINGRKGDLGVGMDADFVIVDLKREDVLSKENMYTKSSANVFDEYHVMGRPILTAVRGETIMQNGEIVGKAGYGEFVSTELFQGKS
jgi:allantoinase